MEERIRPLKKRVKDDVTVAKFDKFDKKKPRPSFKPLEDNFPLKFIVSLESLLLRVTRKELE
jgi:hypothetical protein